MAVRCYGQGPVTAGAILILKPISEMVMVWTGPYVIKIIAPWYDYVESFIGVSGNADGIPHLPDGKFQPPFEMNAVEKYFKATR